MTEMCQLDDRLLSIAERLRVIDTRHPITSSPRQPSFLAFVDKQSLKAAIGRSLLHYPKYDA